MPLYRRNDDLGYEEVYDPSCDRYVKTHRKIARAVYGDYGNGLVIHHQDFDKHNNEPLNLRRMTWEEHTALHMVQTELLIRYAQSEEGRERSRELMNAHWKDSEWREKQLKLLHSHSLQRGKVAVKREIERLKEISERHASAAFREMRRTVAVANLRKVGTETSRRNISEYNAAISSGVIKPTEKQLAARKENARRLNVVRWNHKVVAVERLGKSVDVFDMEVPSYHNFAVSSGVFVHNCGGYDIGDIPTIRPKGCPPAMLIQNSWGSGWGLKGFVWFPLAVLNNPTTDLKIFHSGSPWK